MPKWTQQDDTHTAKVDGYTLTVWKSDQQASWSWLIREKECMIKTGNPSVLEIAKVEAEQALSKLE